MALGCVDRHVAAGLDTERHGKAFERVSHATCWRRDAFAGNKFVEKNSTDVLTKIGQEAHWYGDDNQMEASLKVERASWNESRSPVRWARRMR